MVRYWVFLLVGVSLLQGLLSLSPIPVPDEEWEEFSRMMRDPSYRLPTTTRPKHYEVTLTPYFETVPAGRTPFTFDGSATIYISTTEQNISQIVMHCNDLTVKTVSVEYTQGDAVQQIAAPSQNLQCEMPYSFLRIDTTKSLEPGVEYTVKLSFSGNLQNNMRGFYRSWYKDSTGLKRWIGTTQFQPGHARQAFPCYDEPGFKATFDFTINREFDFSPTVSNMPIKRNVTLADGRIAETFETTPLTSTYLLAFIISHYKVVSTNYDDGRPFEIYARDNAGITGDWSLEAGEKLLKAMEDYTQIPYYGMADKMNMKQAAIPDFSAGAMENWGLLTYREALILFDKLNSNYFYKHRVANIVAHEIAHMWFGNLVTCAWWDNLWLNEGFARFYQYYLTGSVFPELGFETRFIVEQYQTALSSDSLDSAHALTDPSVNDPTTVSAHFSTITYARGASILRMTQHLLGDSTYVKGIRSYLQARKYDVAEPHHLFEALDAAAAQDGALNGYNGTTIDRYFKTWSEKAGHPLLTVTVDQSTGQMTVKQARWERNTGVSQFNGVWEIPITWTRGSAPNFENLVPSHIITEESTVIHRGTQGREWVIFNIQASGFYRVNYDDTNWALLTQALRKDPSVIHEINRAQLVDDLFALGRAGVLKYERVFNILSFLEFDDGYAPWISAINGFSFLLRRLAHDNANLQKIQKMIIDLSAAVTKRLGFAEIFNEPFMDGLLRLNVMEFLCDIGHEQCIAAGKRAFQGWRNDEFIPANMRPWVYCVGLREGSLADFIFFWNRYLNEDLASEQIVMLQKAGCTSDQRSLELFLDAIVSEDASVRPQDQTTALNSAVSQNEYNTLRAFEWLKRNVNQTTTIFGSISTPLSYIAGRLLNENDIAAFEAWLEENRDSIGSAYNTGVNGAASARSNLEWSNKRMTELSTYFETGYVEDVFEDGPDSAHTATLSAFVLFVAMTVFLYN